MSSTSRGTTRLLVLPGEPGERLDIFLAQRTAVSRRQIRRWIAEGAISRNGRPLRVASRVLDLADVIDILKEPEETGLPSDPPLPDVAVVHRDDWIVAVDKPFGVLSQPAERRAPGELAMDERLVLYLALQEGRPPYLRLVHRLDRVTSGLLLFAARPEASLKLARAWKENAVERTYRAVVEGVPSFESTTVDAPIARCPGGDWRFEVSETGKAARTEVRVRDTAEGTAEVECRLLTGRTHQVRVHLAHLGHPVVGDVLYGAAPDRASRPLLHASSLTLPHPEDGRLCMLTSPLPTDFPQAADPSSAPPGELQ